MSTNGHLTAAELVAVQGHIQLSKRTAVAWRALVAAAWKELHRTIAIAPPAGGYRSYATQVDMHARPWLYNMNPASSAHLAAPGGSNHGLGLCVDVVGTELDHAFLELAARYGFTRPLENDPNHFLYDGHNVVKTSVVTKLKPAPKTVSYRMEDGDTLSGVAHKFDVSLAHLEQLNPKIVNPRLIRIGQKIRVA